MAGSRLDQIVKGAPPPGTSVPKVLSKSPPPPSKSPLDTKAVEQLDALPPLPDPVANLPSSPSQIYLNLLILEASLRAQYLTLRARRRQHTFFLFLLTLWIAWFSYLLFLRPREDGRGVGGSVYWIIEMGEKVALMAGFVTGMLMWGTGQWERGVKWPRKWMVYANRGLRSVNAKIVVIKGAWWKEILGHLSFLFPYSSFFPTTGPSYHHVEAVSEKHGHEDEALSYEEDLSPGGDHIKLLLLPKPFSPDFRENWELYRTEYWEKENERRARLRQAVGRKEKEMAKKENGWLYYLGWRKPRRHIEPIIKVEHVEKMRHRLHPEKEGKRRYSVNRSESRNTSRSSTPTNLDIDEKSISSRSRRGSATSSASERRRKTKQSASIDQNSMKLTAVSRPA